VEKDGILLQPDYEQGDDDHANLETKIIIKKKA
jgi:hypothetical protein